MTKKAVALIATLAATAALAATPALAARQPLKVSEHIDISAPPAKVWDVVRDFGNLNWHPAVASTSLDKGSKDKRGAVRTVTIKDGAKLVEELLSHQDSTRSFKYRIIDSPLPVSDYVSTFQVKATKSGSRVEWSSTFKRKDEKPAEGADNAGAKKVISGIYTSGLEELKQKLEAR